MRWCSYEFMSASCTKKFGIVWTLKILHNSHLLLYINEHLPRVAHTAHPISVIFFKPYSTLLFSEWMLMWQGGAA